MDRRIAVRSGLLAAGLLMVGMVGWVGGLFATAQYWEDVCFDDIEARPGYGSYRSQVSIWPPTFECRLYGSDVEAVVVQHPVAALSRFGTAAVFPVAYGLVAALFLVWAIRRDMRSHSWDAAEVR
ncbi:MAG: hypothetical protein U9O18_07510 [Chloroflexota bacterium]|nr:hypothetical protein [Chloroflexota bacterium]